MRRPIIHHGTAHASLATAGCLELSSAWELVSSSLLSSLSGAKNVGKVLLIKAGFTHLELFYFIFFGPETLFTKALHH